MLSKVLNITFTILFATIVLNPKLATWSAIIITLIWLYMLFKRELTIKHHTLIYLVISFILLYASSYLLNIDSRIHLFEIEKRVGILLLIPLLTAGFLPKEKLPHYGKTFVASVYFAMLFSIVKILLFGKYDLTYTEQDTLIKALLL